MSTRDKLSQQEILRNQRIESNIENQKYRSTASASSNLALSGINTKPMIYDQDDDFSNINKARETILKSNFAINQKDRGSEIEKFIQYLLRDGDILSFNQYYGLFSKEIENIKITTADNMLQNWERFKEKILSQKGTPISILTQDDQYQSDVKNQLAFNNQIEKAIDLFRADSDKGINEILSIIDTLKDQPTKLETLERILRASFNTNDANYKTLVREINLARIAATPFKPSATPPPAPPVPTPTPSKKGKADPDKVARDAAFNTFKTINENDYKTYDDFANSCKQRYDANPAAYDSLTSVKKHNKGGKQITKPTMVKYIIAKFIDERGLSASIQDIDNYAGEMKRRAIFAGASGAGFDKPKRALKKLLAFGCLAVDEALFNKNQFKLYYPNGYVYRILKATLITDDLKSLFEDAMTGKRLNAKQTLARYEKLGESEQNLYNRVMHITDNINLKLNDEPSKNDYISRFNILKGEVIAGNDNPQILKELKALALKLYDLNYIDRKTLNELSNLLLYV
jgi:hypothetical protein